MTTALPMTERDLQTTVIEIAKLYGWLVSHQRPARTSNGWRTPIEGHAGFFDLVLARSAKVVQSSTLQFNRPPRLLFVELKTTRGRLTPEQRRWHETMAQMPYVETGIWTPDDLRSGRVENALT